MTKSLDHKRGDYDYCSVDAFIVVDHGIRDLREVTHDPLARIDSYEEL